MAALDRYITALIVILVHAIVLMLLFSSNQPPPAESPSEQKAVHVQLASPQDISSVTEPVDKQSDSDVQETTAEDATDNDATRSEQSNARSQSNEDTWNPRDVEDIRQSQLKDTDRRANEEQQSGPSAGQELLKTLDEFKQDVSIQTDSSDTSSYKQSALSDYYSALHDFLYQKWDPPSSNRVSRRGKGVEVKLRIRSQSGQATAEIVQSYAAEPVVRSVRRLINNLSRVPAPAEYGIEQRTVSPIITFRLQADE